MDFPIVTVKSHHAGDLVVIAMPLEPGRPGKFVTKSYEMRPDFVSWTLRFEIASTMSSACFLTSEEAAFAIRAFNERQWMYFKAPACYEDWELIVMNRIPQTLKPEDI